MFGFSGCSLFGGSSGLVAILCLLRLRLKSRPIHAMVVTNAQVRTSMFGMICRCSFRKFVSILLITETPSVVPSSPDPDMPASGFMSDGEM